MQWARFRSNDGRTGFGVFDGKHIAEYAGDMFGAPPATGRTVAGGSFALAGPRAPSQILALWNNLNELSIKLATPPPSHPLFLIKPGTSVIGPNEPIRRPTGYTGKIAYEGELGIVVGKLCKDVAPDAARDHIFGYTCVNDVTASGVLNENVNFAQWCRSKGFDTFGCLGPVIATGLEWSRLRVITRVDGVERQNYPLSDMIMRPEELVSRISHDMSLLPGDVIACGTSVGGGSIKDGGAVGVNIDGVGSLVNVLSPSP